MAMRDTAIAAGEEAVQILDKQWPVRMDALRSLDPDLFALLVERVACRAASTCLAEAHQLRDEAHCLCPGCRHLASIDGRCHVCHEAGCGDEVLCQAYEGNES